MHTMGGMEGAGYVHTCDAIDSAMVSIDAEKSCDRMEQVATRSRPSFGKQTHVAQALECRFAVW